MRDASTLQRLTPVALGLAVVVFGAGVVSAATVDPEAGAAKYAADEPRVVASDISEVRPRKDDPDGDGFVDITDAIPGYDDGGDGGDEFEPIPPLPDPVELPDLTGYGFDPLPDELVEYGTWTDAAGAAIVLQDPANPDGNVLLTELFERLGFVWGEGHVWVHDTDAVTSVEVLAFQLDSGFSAGLLADTFDMIGRRQGLEPADTAYEGGTAMSGFLTFDGLDVHTYTVQVTQDEYLFRVLIVSDAVAPDPAVAESILAGITANG